MGEDTKAGYHTQHNASALQPKEDSHVPDSVLQVQMQKDLGMYA